MTDLFATANPTLYYFLSYTSKPVMGEVTSYHNIVINIHPFDWLTQKIKFKNIETITILFFQNISQTEFKNFPGEKFNGN